MNDRERATPNNNIKTNTYNETNNIYDNITNIKTKPSIKPIRKTDVTYIAKVNGNRVYTHEFDSVEVQNLFPNEERNTPYETPNINNQDIHFILSQYS